MLVQDLDDRIYHWNVNKTQKFDDKNKSNLHLSCRELLKKNFPAVSFLEEVPVKIRGTKKLILDFYIPLRETAIEVHGKQHYHYTPYFHRNKAHFLKMRRNDREKSEWCEINNIKLIVLDYNETVNEWYQKLI